VREQHLGDSGDYARPVASDRRYGKVAHGHSIPRLVGGADFSIPRETTMTMSKADLAEERRRGRIAGAATIVAGLLIGAGMIWDGFANRDRPDGKNDDAERLRFFDDHSTELIAANGLRSVGFLLLAFAIVHLQRATRARNPELASVTLVIGLFGAVALGVGFVGHAAALAAEASDFAAKQFATPAAADKAAEDAATQGLPLLTGIFAFAGTIAISFWFVIASLNAMRVGLLTRFMGVLGIIVGPGFIFGFAPPVMVFWLVAVGVLFLGRWPRGLPPAWEAGEAVPWPSRGRQPEPADEALETSASSRNGEVEPVGPGVRRPEAEQPSDSSPPSTRRKRKRRR
jgi:hypothetical protein